MTTRIGRVAARRRAASMSVGTPLRATSRPTNRMVKGAGGVAAVEGAAATPYGITVIGTSASSRISVAVYCEMATTCRDDLAARARNPRNQGILLFTQRSSTP